MDLDQAKLFVGGISRETTEETLKLHFSKYGEVLGSLIAKDRNTKCPRGFGFVWFSEASSADKALEETHAILGRTVEVKKAIPRSEHHQNEQQQQQEHSNMQQTSGLNGNGSNGFGTSLFRIKKIFVGGLSASLTEEEFKNYFERFGRITDVVVMHDNETNRPRGFGFVTFDSEESVDNVMQKKFHELNGKLVEVKRAIPKEGSNISSAHYNTRIRGGRGSPYISSQSGNYPPYGPGCGVPMLASLPGYDGVGGYSYGMGIYGGGYPLSGYGRIGHGFTPVAPRSPWNGFMMVGARICPIPYSNTLIYPPYMNTGVDIMGVTTVGHDGIAGPVVNGKFTQVFNGTRQLPVDVTPRVEGVKLDVDVTPPQIERVKLDDSSGLMGSNGTASSEQSQSSVDGLIE